VGLLARFDRVSLDSPVERFSTKHAGVKHMYVTFG